MEVPAPNRLINLITFLVCYVTDKKGLVKRINYRARSERAGRHEVYLILVVSFEGRDASIISLDWLKLRLLRDFTTIRRRND